jgi:Yip1-like protein
MNLVQRAKGILLQPKFEWLVIEREPGDAGTLFPNYVCILAAIPVVCSFIGTSIIGFGPFRVGIVSGLLHAVVVYALTLASVFVVAYIIDALAGMFGGQKNFDNAMKVSAYAPTAAWLAGVFSIIPALSILGLLGLYSLYLLHTGIAALMKPAAGKELVYTLAVVVCVIVIQVIIFFVIVRTIFGVPGVM